MCAAGSLGTRSCPLVLALHYFSRFCTVPIKRRIFPLLIPHSLLVLLCTQGRRFEVTNCDLKNEMAQTATALARRVETKIFVLRGHRIIVDETLAELYGVEVKQLNQQVKRNSKRFPSEFVFRLSQREFDFLRSQIVTSNDGRGGRRYRPFAFTEHGAIMAATVLKSRRAIQMSIFVVRAFVRMREALAQNQQILSKLADIERRLESHETDI